MQQAAPDGEGELVQRDPASGLSFVLGTRPPPGFVECLERTHWGTRALRYFMIDVAPEVARVPRSHFLTAQTDQGQVVGTYWLIDGELRWGARRCRSRYRTMLSVDERFAGKGVGRTLAEIARRRLVESCPDPLVVYGFVEKGNERPLRLAHRLGYEAVRKLWAPNIGWHRPRDDARVGPMEPGERDRCVGAIESYHAGHVLPCVGAELLSSECFVLREGGEVVCGAQVVAKHLRVTSLGGAVGRVVMTVFPPFARWSPIFEVRRRHMLWLGNLFARPGAERELPRLFEALLFRTRAHAAVAYFDPETSLYAALEQARGFGPLARVAPATEVQVMAGGTPGGHEFLKASAGRPWLASAMTAT